MSLKANEPILEQKQEEEQQDDDSKNTEENSEQAEPMKSQVETQKDSIEEKQKDGAEVTSGEKTEEDNKAAALMKLEVGSQSSDAKKQQDGAKVDKNVEETEITKTSEQKGKELQSKLTPVSLSFNNQGHKYFYLKLQTSNETFEKIKQDRLKFTLDRVDREYDELASEFGHNGRNIYYLNFKDEGNGNVSFEISSNLSYGAEDEKGTYKVTKVWLSNDSSQTNLLKEESKTVQVS